MKRSLEVPRIAARHLSTRGPRGPRSIVDKSRTASRIGPTSRASRAGSRPPQHNRFQSSQPPYSQQNGQQQPSGKNESEQPSKVELVSTALANNESSDLLAPVNMPDDPDGVLSKNHPAMSLLNNSSLVIQRQIEMMNVFLGFEQANKYIIMNGRGETIGYMAEQDHGLGNALARQAFRTHRSFTAHIFDADQREVLRIHRPFSWISSRIRIYDPCSPSGEDAYAASTALQGTSAASALDPAAASHISSLPLSEMRIIGESQQQWAPLRRKYNLFNYRPIAPPRDDVAKLTSGDQPNTEAKALTVTQQPEAAIEAGMSQFAYVNEPVLSWDFTLKDSEDRVKGSVNRNFAGFAREIFTDTGVYALRMDSASLAQEPHHLISQTGKIGVEEPPEETAMTLDQRAVMLATAVCIDFDYFSRHSGAGGGGFGFFPMWFPGMGGAAEGGAAGGAVGGAAGAGEVGAAEGAGGALGGAARGAGVGEGAIAGAGTMAGVEAMQRGRNQQNADDASPTAQNDPYQQDPQQYGQSGEQYPDQQSPWGEQGADPWGQDQPDQNDPWNQQQGGDSGGGGGDGGSFWDDLF